MACPGVSGTISMSEESSKSTTMAGAWAACSFLRRKSSLAFSRSKLGSDGPVPGLEEKFEMGSVAAGSSLVGLPNGFGAGGTAFRGRPFPDDLNHD